MSRHYQAISMAEFEAKLLEASKAHYMRKEGYLPEPWYQNGEWIWRTHWPELTAKIIKDLSKISVYPENFETQCGDFSMLGLNLLPNGMPYLGVWSFGDGEAPVFQIIYWSGNELRGYTPNDGNCFNPKRKAAWGDMNTYDDIQEEEIALLKSMGFNVENDTTAAEYMSNNFVWDAEKLQADIMNRIVLS